MLHVWVLNFVLLKSAVSLIFKNCINKAKSQNPIISVCTELNPPCAEAYNKIAIALFQNSKQYHSKELISTAQ